METFRLYRTIKHQHLRIEKVRSDAIPRTLKTLESARMFLASRPTLGDLGRGAAISKRRTNAETMTSNGYGCGRSYSHTAHCAPLVDNTNVGNEHFSESGVFAHRRSPPPSPSTSVLPANGGVFLPNCQISADFLQLRTKDFTAAPSTPVRLYLTSTELIRKNATTNDSTRRGVRAGFKDITMSSYPLQDVEITKSKVSPNIMMVSVSGCVPSGDSLTYKESVGYLNSTLQVANARADCGNEYRSVGLPNSNGIILVEAYQLCPDQHCTIQDWITSIEKSKRKLAVLHRLKQGDASSNVLELTNHTHHQQSTTPPSTTMHTQPRPTSIVIATTSPKRRPEKTSLYRRSHSGHEFASLEHMSPTREKLHTTANGRYTPLHHHYTPHPLFSNSASTRVHRRQHHSEREPLKFFRRLSLGGGQKGTYRFPPSPADLNENNTITHGRRGTGTNTKITKSMFSLERSSTELFQDSCSQPSESSFNLSLTDQYNKSSLSQPTTPQHDHHNTHDILRRKRRPTLSRSVSEYQDNNDYDNIVTLKQESVRESLVKPDTKHQIQSDPLPIVGSVHNRDGSNDASEDSVPPELKALLSLINSLPPTPPPHSPTTTHLLPSPSPRLTPLSRSPSDNDEEDDDAGFQSFLRHKQIRGRKIHVSPRAHSSSVSSEVLSPPAWVDKFQIPASTDATIDRVRLGTGGSASLPRGHKITSEANSPARITKTLDREGIHTYIVCIIILLHDIEECGRSRKGELWVVWQQQPAVCGSYIQP